ncbi:tol-pal system protein YbgF [Thiomicrospira microaerophila]|uniref:tol-pal system protein YbgF n=1 Tax=Thiomicrospira microaerophila TaxID=406020 RepID=UPI00200C569C|nr:tol-pal system protein YbgF [Thiomicrospira microaerophila]UQB41459.1 tol-pal system protein YbgF [Thiomicrospira microaerophila]
MALAFSGSLQAQTLEQRVDRLERMADNPVLLQHTQRIDQQQREIQALHDRLDRQDRLISSLQTLLKQFEASTDHRLTSLEKKTDSNKSAEPQSLSNLNDSTNKVLAEEDRASLEGLPRSLNQQMDEPDEVILTPRLAEDRALYDSAFNALRESRFDQSIELFTGFLETYPSSSLTSDALYWLGEAYMIKQSFSEAYSTFNELMETHPSSSKFSDAMLRAADSLVGLQKLNEAEQMYRKLIELLPESRSAKTAERRLERFN